jgi:hypothetical protein
MVYGVFSWKNPHISELPWTRLLQFQREWARVWGFQKENIPILVPYLAGLCIIPFPTTVATTVICLAKQWIFHFTCSREGPYGWFVVRWLLQFSHIGVIEARPNPRLHVFSRCVGIHWFISETWPLKYKLQKEVQKIHLIFLRKLRRGVLDVWNTKTYLKLGLSIDPPHMAGAESLIFDPTIIICAIKPYEKNYR